MEPGARADRPMPRVALALACLYAPYAWLLLLDGPWDSYRWHWVRMWPILPGLLAHAIPAVHRLADGLGYVVMAMATSLVFALVVSLARRGRRTAILVSVVVAAFSVANAWIAYRLFLA